MEEKRKTYKKILQRNMPEEVRERRKREYRDRKALVKRLVRESKERVDEDCGRKLSAEYVENKKLFWREVRKEMGGRKSEACRMRRSDGVIVRRNEEIREVWKSHFEKVMNEGMGGRAEVTTMGIKIHEEWPHAQGILERSEIVEAIRKLKLGKVPGPDGITVEMLKYGGELVIDWMVWICNLAWEQSRVPEAWSKAITVLLYKGIGNREECNNYRGISLLSVPGKIYGRILNERMMKITDKSVGAEQGGFQKGRGCVDQIFAVKILVEKYLEKDRKLFAAFMDLEKAYDRVDRKSLWDTLRVCGVGGQLLEGIRSFCENASASVRVNGELSESFNIEMGVRQGCVMSPWLFSIYLDGCIREMKVRVQDLGARLNVRGVEQPLVAGFFRMTVLLAETGGMLQRIVDEFDRVCKRRNLKVNAGKSKVMVFERAKEQSINSAKPYRVGSDATPGCKIWLGKEKMEEVN